jgi:small-conductance mechanosensitive channel
MSEEINTNEVSESVETAPEEAVESKEENKDQKEKTEGEALAEKKASGEKLTKKEERQLKEYKLKVNGKEKVVKLDPFNDEEVSKYLQKAEASDAKFQEAAEVRKAAMQFIEELRKNPKKILMDPNIGVDYKKLAQEWMNEEIQEMEKTPEQKEREKLQKELEAIKKEREEEKKASEQRELERLQAEHERNLESEISAALDVGGLPKTARTVKAMAEMMMIALQHGIDLSPKEIAPIVKTTTLGEFKEVVNSLSDDQLEDFLGKEIIGRLRKRSVAKMKSVETANSVKPTGNSVKKEEAPKESKKISIRDFLRDGLK